MTDRLVDPRGESLMTQEEVDKRIRQIVEAATTPGLKKLFSCKDMWEAQMLWATGEITAAEMSAFLLINLGHDLRVVKTAFEQFRLVGMLSDPRA